VGHILILFDPLGEAEVGDMGHAGRIDQDVGGLEVAVQHTAAVGRIDCLSHEGQDSRGLPRWHRLGSKPLGECRSLDQSHAVEGMAATLSHLEDRDDARVVESGGRLRLAAKPHKVGSGGEIPPQEHLQGHCPTKAFLAGTVDNSHASSAELFEQFVVVERRRQRCDPGYK
jgi:hypothetical protein